MTVEQAGSHLFSCRGRLLTRLDHVVAGTANTVEHDGLQPGEEKDPVAPAGSPDTLKETAGLRPVV